MLITFPLDECPNFDMSDDSKCRLIENSFFNESGLYCSAAMSNRTLFFEIDADQFSGLNMRTVYPHILECLSKAAKDIF